MENKHTSYDLAQMQSLSLSSKIRMSKQRIDAWVDTFGEEGCYIAVSGGKDSQVLQHLIKDVCGYKNIQSVFVNTGLEYDCVRKKWD